MTTREILSRVDRYIEENVEQFVGQLGRLCAQPSISAQKVGIAECAKLTATMLEEAGFEAERGRKRSAVPAAGIAYPGTHAHAPNENVRIDYFLQGIRHTARVIEAFGRMEG